MDGFRREIRAFVVILGAFLWFRVAKSRLLVGFCGHSFAADAAIFLFEVVACLALPLGGGEGGFSFLFVLNDLRRLSSLTCSSCWG